MSPPADLSPPSSIITPQGTPSRAKGTEVNEEDLAILSRAPLLQQRDMRPPIERLPDLDARVVAVIRRNGLHAWWL